MQLQIEVQVMYCKLCNRQNLDWTELYELEFVEILERICFFFSYMFYVLPGHSFVHDRAHNVRRMF
jgi:hypothetical protein